nr:adhesive plaque matrix protein 2-like [Penaeus vannamei]
MVPRGAFLLLAVAAIWLSGCTRPAASEADAHATCICVPRGSCSQPVSNATCDSDEQICCSMNSAVGRRKREKPVKPQRIEKKKPEGNGKNRKSFRRNSKNVTQKGGQNNLAKKVVTNTNGSKKCTKDYGRCKSKCRGQFDNKRVCPNGKVCCINPAKTRNKVIAKANDCTAAGGVCKKSNKKCKEPLSIQCPDNDKICCTKTTKNNCKSKGFRCVKNCKGTTMKIKGCKEGRVCCKQAQKGNCKQVGGNCKEEAKCNTEVLKPNKPCKDGKICCKKGNNKCKDLGGRCRKEAKCTGQIFTPSIPCKDGNVCCNKGKINVKIWEVDVERKPNAQANIYSLYTMQGW